MLQFDLKHELVFHDPLNGFNEYVWKQKTMTKPLSHILQ